MDFFSAMLILISDVSDFLSSNLSAFIGGEMNLSWGLVINFIDELLTTIDVDDVPDFAVWFNTL